MNIFSLLIWSSWPYQVIGNGSFGVVTLAQLCDDAKTPVAIKKVLQDRRYKVCEHDERGIRCSPM